MNEQDLRDIIDAAMKDRQLVEFGGSPPGGNTWAHATLLATVLVLREWNCPEDELDATPLEVVLMAVHQALERLTELPEAAQHEARSAEKPDQPRLAGKGVVQETVRLAAAWGSERLARDLRSCPRCGTAVCLVVRDSRGALWLAIEGPCVTDPDGVLDIRPASTHDVARRRPAASVDGVAWPARDIESFLPPPVTLRCHGNARTLSRGARGSERCGALIRIDRSAVAHEV